MTGPWSAEIGLVVLMLVFIGGMVVYILGKCLRELEERIEKLERDRK